MSSLAEQVGRGGRASGGCFRCLTVWFVVHSTAVVLFLDGVFLFFAGNPDPRGSSVWKNCFGSDMKNIYHSVMLIYWNLYGVVVPGELLRRCRQYELRT